MTTIISRTAMRSRIGAAFDDEVRSRLLAGEISLKDGTGEYRVSAACGAAPGQHEDGPSMAIARRAMAEIAQRRAAGAAAGPGPAQSDEEPPPPPAAIDVGDQIVELMDAKRQGRAPAQWATIPLPEEPASTADEGPNMRRAREALAQLKALWQQKADASAPHVFYAKPGFAGKDLR